MAGELSYGAGVFDGDERFAAAAEGLRVNEADAIIEGWLDPARDRFRDRTTRILSDIVLKHGVEPHDEAVFQLLEVLAERVPIHWAMQKARDESGSG